MQRWQKFSRRKLALLAVLLAAFDGNCLAATFTVSNNADSGPGSLRKAVDDSNAASGTNDIVISVDGETTLWNGELLITNSANISGVGAPWFILKGTYSNRVFHIVNASVTISGITIANGSNSLGGGILQEAGALALNSCVLVKNKALDGAAIAQVGGTLTLTDCTISTNNAASTGSGIYTQNNAATRLRRCTLAANIGSGFSTAGGAIAQNGLSLSLETCTFFGNGGLGIGGALLNNSGQTGITNCTFYANQALQGGGIAPMAGTVAIRNSIIASNTSIVSGSAAAPDCYGGIISAGFNLVGNAANSSGWGTAGDMTGNPAAPINPQLGPLQNNGGPTWTMEPLGASLAIDRGNSSGITDDQRGSVRPFDKAVPNPVGGDGSDIGAFEVGPRSLTVTTVNDSGPGSLRQAILEADPTEATRINFSPGLVGNTIQVSSELVVDKDVIINGPGASALSLMSATRAFHVVQGNSTISGLTIRGCNVTGNDGAYQLDGEEVRGGAILNESTLRISDCVISNNVAQGGRGGETTGYYAGNGGDSFGGGIANYGLLYLTRCLLANNSAIAGLGGEATDGGNPGYNGNAYGGSLYNRGSAYLTNCCVYGSLATAGEGSERGLAAGGGIYNYSDTLSLLTSTVASNTAFLGTGGGIYDGGHTGVYRSSTLAGNGASIGGGIYAAGSDFGNTLIAANSAGAGVDAKGNIVSSGYNLIQSFGGFVVDGNDTNSIYGVDPLLGALQNNGGPLPTMALLAGSPAIDHGANFGIVTDLRGRERPFDLPEVANVPGGNGTDIGAYEFNVSPLRITRSGSNVVLSWSTNDPSWKLEATTDCASPGSWALVAGSPIVSSNQFLMVDPLQKRKFYRLRSP